MSELTNEMLERYRERLIDLGGKPIQYDRKGRPCYHMPLEFFGTEEEIAETKRRLREALDEE